MKTCVTCGQAVDAVPLPMWWDGDTAVIDGKHYRLTMTQADILRAIEARYPRVVAHHAIYQDVYGLLQDWPSEHLVPVHICKMRKMLSGAPIAIQNEWGRGYRLVVEEQKDCAA